MNGWIKIHRTMLQWEHFNEPSVVTVFLALLLNADKDGKTGITIGGIASVTKLHNNTVKRAIAKLVASGEITRQKYGSRITTTITNWSEYQMGQNSTQSKKPLGQNSTQYRVKNWANISPKSDPIQYNKNNKKDKENIVVADAHARTHDDFIADALNDLRVEQGCMAMRISPEEYRQLVNEVINDWTYRQLPDNEWTLTHLLAQMRIKHNINNRNNGNNQYSGQPGDTRAKLDADAVKAMAALEAESRHPAQPTW